MQPLGRKPLRFPGKTDCHPKAPLQNWWEQATEGADKKASRQAAQREIAQELADATPENG